MPAGFAFDSLTGGGGITGGAATATSGDAGGNQGVNIGGIKKGIEIEDALPVVAVIVIGLIAWRAIAP